jgi:Fur family ferric uptake transcriptional regulator
MSASRIRCARRILVGPAASNSEFVAAPRWAYNGAVRQSTIVKRFEDFLQEQALKLTPQRRRIFDRAFSTHDHFTAEMLFGWLKEEDGPRVSRATVYRTLEVLLRGGFIAAMDIGQGELVYEHVLGHHHHDHMVCVECGRIEEFHDERIEAAQEEAASKKGFVIQNHVHRLMGLCRNCSRE